MRSVLYRLLFSVALLFLSACSSSVQPHATWPAPGRYAVQWKAYLGAGVGEAVYPQFAFIDVYAQQRPHSVPQIHELVLLTDRGPIRAIPQGPVTPGPAHPNHQLFTLLTQVSGLPAGTYTFHEIQYVDEFKQKRRLAVGVWVIEVLPEAANALHEISHSVGATHFSILETEIQNPLPETITLDGLHFALPGLPVTSTMVLEQAAPDHPHSSPASLSDFQLLPFLTIPGALTLAPGEQARLAFLFGPDAVVQHERFVQLKPLLRYHIAAMPAFYSVAQQVYSRPFTDDTEIISYLHALPTAAYHSLP